MATDLAAMDDVYSDVIKTTGLTREQVEELNESFKHLDTRTSREQLNNLAYIVGKLGVDFFFAHPYHSWERGANENTNGLIRQYIPKGSSFENLTDDCIRLIERKLNNRPREELGFLTPNEKLFSIFAAIN